MHPVTLSASVVNSVVPLFDFPVQKSEDDEYSLPMDDVNPADVPIAFTKSQVQSVIIDSGIMKQLALAGIEITNTAFLQPDLCTLDDWQQEVDKTIEPNIYEGFTDREIDEQINTLLTSMNPKEHFMNAATYYLENPREYSAFFKDPRIIESCRFLGIDISAIPYRTLKSFKHQPDSAETLSDVVAKARYEAHQHECQLSIAIILQAQPLIEAKLKHAQVGPLETIPHHNRAKSNRTHTIQTPQHFYDKAKDLAERQRLVIMKQAKILENAERWKETQVKINKAINNRIASREAAELKFKKKEFEKEVKLKSYDAVAEQRTRRKMILDGLDNHTPIQLKPRMKEEARLVKELHVLDLDDHLHRSQRLKHASHCRKQHTLEKSNKKLARLASRGANATSLT